MLPRSLHTAGFALIAAGLAGCGQDPPQAQPPQGAVLRIGEEWVLGQDVDTWVEGIKLIEPGQTLSSLRRKALINIVIPCAISRQLFEEDRDREKAEIQRISGALERGDPLEPEVLSQFMQVKGHALEIGLDRWIVAMKTPLGEWSEPFEGLGSFSLVRRLDGPAPADWNALTRVTVEYLTQHYIYPSDDPEALITSARKAMDIVVVDPAWEWVSPKWLELESAEQ